MSKAVVGIVVWVTACAANPPRPGGGGSEPPNHAPELKLPPYTQVGLGQTIGFGIEVIDEESDAIRVELEEKPASATYDPRTLTVVWRAAAEDQPAGRFQIRVTEAQREGGARRVFRHSFSIPVVEDFQPRPVAQPLDPFTELVLTVHDLERLARVQEAWPLPRVLALAAELEARKQGKAIPIDGEALYRSMLVGLAEAHGNPRVNPGSKAFEAEVWATSESWRIMAVRFRLDKHWQELRLVYKNFRSHEGVYVMPRWRVVADGPEVDEADRVYNNQAISRLVLDRFFGADGRLREDLWRDEAAHGRAVAEAVTAILQHPVGQAARHAGATFLALPTEARLGGGSLRDDLGQYQSGDGWAWTVMQPKLAGDAMAFVNIPIKGFATAFAEDPASHGWKPVCAKGFDPRDPGHVPGLEMLCRVKEGLVDLPFWPGGKLQSAAIDAVSLHVEHKRGAAIQELPLRDPRRDLAEENGMTCAECHTRAFGVRDLYDPAVTDARRGAPRAANPAQDRSFFVLAPGERWQPYMIDFQRRQTCLARDAFKAALGVDVQLTCPARGE
jgi:hypothetical protein